MSDIQHLELTSANGDSRVVVSTWGARVIEWKHRGVDVLFRSQMLERDEMAAEHCGIPILFPQFGMFGSGVKHGVVRGVNWTIESQSRDQCILQFESASDESASQVYDFISRIIIQVDDDRLRVWLQAENTSDSDALIFTAGLHTYLAVFDVADTDVRGLRGTNYLDATSDLSPDTELAATIQIDGEIDRVYLDTPAEIVINASAHPVCVKQSGFEDTVVWNPGPELGPAFSDLNHQEWRQFLCIEAAQIANPVTLQPGESWTGSQTLTVR